MKYDRYQYFILCEDKSQYDFASGWLQAKGVNRRRIYPVGEFPHPGCGYAYVRDNVERLAKVVATKNSGEANTCLIVFCDADRRPLSHVMDDMGQCAGDSVFLIIARRNVQTWFHFLANQNDVDAGNEDIDRKRNYLQAPCGQLGKRLTTFTLGDLRSAQGCPSSLLDSWERASQQKTSLP